MALKRFTSAIDDCQVSSALQNHKPNSKTLVLLAKSHLALGDYVESLRHIQAVLDFGADPSSNPILATKAEAIRMQNYIDQSRQAWARKVWNEAALNITKADLECQGLCPLQWSLWRVEIKIALQDWSGAETLAE